jgi:mono/diheme cytochrome c family protein
MNVRSNTIAAVSVIAVVLGYSYFTKPDSALKASGQPIVQVSVPQLTGIAVQGQDLFSENCASCHGENATGREGLAPPLVHKIYRPNHHADIAFELAASIGVRSHHWPFGGMPPVEGVTNGDVKKITAYIRALQRENGIN